MEIGITLLIIIFLLGLSLGSFLNVVIFRYLSGGSIISPRSYCPHCLHSLQWFDLIPVLSFFLLKGKCRYCSEMIPFSYPLVEFLTGLIFIICLFYYGFTPEFLKYTFVLCLLLLISVIDQKKQIVPNVFVIVLFSWLIVWHIVLPHLTNLSALVGFLAGGLLFFIIALVSKGGMGGGDIKLMAVLGFAVGWPYVLILFLLSFIIGAAVGVSLMLFCSKSKESPLAFAPFLSLSYFIILFWGEEIWWMYYYYIL